MPVHAYGLHWKPEDVDWSGRVNGAWRMPGRVGAHRPGLRVADLRHQQGIYVLYGHHGAYYVGLARKQGIGERIKAHHLTDSHRGMWTNFSWFGFRQVLKTRDDVGFQRLKHLPNNILSGDDASIADFEALLIKAMNLQNKQKMRFTSPYVDQWTQVPARDLARYLAKVNP